MSLSLPGWHFDIHRSSAATVGGMRRIRCTCALVWTRRLVPVLMVCAFAPSVAQRAAPEISRERLRADLEFLTSARLEGRASLTPGAAAAARFIAAELAKAGVRPASGDSYLQPFDLQPVRLDRDRTLIVVRHGGEEERGSHR